MGLTKEGRAAKEGKAAKEGMAAKEGRAASFQIERNFNKNKFLKNSNILPKAISIFYIIVQNK